MFSELIERIRRNHALEHATLRLLESRRPSLRAGGRATAHGFYLYGDLPDGVTVQAAAEEAIQRLQAGQRELAIHPRCGTNVVATGALSGALALLSIALSGRNTPWYVQLPNAMLGAMIGALLAVPVGTWMQAHLTTSANATGARVRRVHSKSVGQMTAHFVETEHPPARQ
jgi:hypothetical protein